MDKNELIGKVVELLNTDMDLDFLKRLTKEELERLVAVIRDKVDRV